MNIGLQRQTEEKARQPETERDVRARPTLGRVAPAKGNAELPERP
jgi:hypothetical protein